MVRELLLGCGNSREKKISVPTRREWGELVTLDIDPACGADIIHDLNTMPYPLQDGDFDEIHAYEVLEHIGTQGDWRGWFAMWSEFYRALKPNGMFFGSCPHRESKWVWGDPGHTRYVGPESMVFLDQHQYAQIGATPMTDYRHVWGGSFELIYSEISGESWWFILRRA